MPRHLTSHVRAVFLCAGLVACGSDSSATNEGDPPAGDRDATPGATPDANGGGEPGEDPGPGATGCDVSADHVVRLSLGAGDFMQETVATGPAFEWNLVATPESELPAIAPGDTVAVRVDLTDAPLTVQRDGRNFYASVSFSAGRSTTAQSALELDVSSEGTLTIGALNAALSTNAGGQPIALRLESISVNPNANETVTCVAFLVTAPVQANRVDDSSLIDVVAGDPLPLQEVRLSVTGDGAAEPFGLGFGM